LSGLQRFARDKGLKITYTELGLIDAPKHWNSDKVFGYKVKIQRGRKSFTFPYYMGVGLANKRPDHNVLDCLISDAMSYRDSRDIEDFANQMCYDPCTPKEMKKVQKIYKACENTLKNLEHLFTEDEIDELAESL
jgi:hypothetical protein